ncbi:MAG: hypothetical protein QXW80_04240 [Candidatus Micrarchaeia archaeon]
MPPMLKEIQNEREEINKILGKIKEIAERKVTEFSIKDLEDAKGSFFKIELNIKNDNFKKKLINEVYDFIRENGYQIVFRLGEESNKSILYIGKSYAREINYFLPSKDIIQGFIDDAIKRKNLTGKGYELYANPNMGILVKVKDGEIEDVTILSGASISIPLRTGTFQLGQLEKGGWVIPAGRKGFSEIREQYPNSFSSPNSPYPWSIFNLMGSAKISFKGTEKLHFRSFIYPGFIGEAPLGSEAGILDDLYNQTTAGCLFVGEGSFYAIKKGNKYITGTDEEIRKKDVGVLLHNGELNLEPLEIGTRLRMRNGEWATLSLDQYNNQVWLDENGYYVPFDSINFDWDSKEMPQIVWKPPEFGESKFINNEISNKQIYIDDKRYYIVERDDKLQVVIYPQRYYTKGKDTKQLKEEIQNSLSTLLSKRDLEISEDEIKNLDHAIKIAQLTPIMINIDISKFYAER